MSLTVISSIFSLDQMPQPSFQNYKSTKVGCKIGYQFYEKSKDFMQYVNDRLFK